MGGKFLSYLNPLSAGPIGGALMNTPFMQKLNHDDPLVSALHGTAGSALIPSSEQSADAYTASHPQPAGANTFTGQDPTLHDANAGYTGTPAGATNDTTAPGYGMNAGSGNVTVPPVQTAARQNTAGVVPGQVANANTYGVAANNATSRIRNIGWGG